MRLQRVTVSEASHDASLSNRQEYLAWSETVSECWVSCSVGGTCHVARPCTAKSVVILEVFCRDSQKCNSPNLSDKLTIAASSFTSCDERNCKSVEFTSQRTFSLFSHFVIFAIIFFFYVYIFP